MSSLLHDEKRTMFRLATLSRFDMAAGGNDGLVAGFWRLCELSSKVMWGEEQVVPGFLQPPPSLPATPRETSQEHVEVPSISPKSSMENQRN